jgi:deoxycytidylate deaminase
LPCPNCALLMINAGIARVVWDEDYRIRDSLTLFHEASILVERYGSIAS